MEEKKDKTDDPVVDLFPDDDADDRAGESPTAKFVVSFSETVLALRTLSSYYCTVFMFTVVRFS